MAKKITTLEDVRALVLPLVPMNMRITFAKAISDHVSERSTHSSVSYDVYLHSLNGDTINIEAPNPEQLAKRTHRGPGQARPSPSTPAAGEARAQTNHGCFLRAAPAHACSLKLRSCLLSPCEF